MFSKEQRSTCYEELPYFYFGPTSSAWLLRPGTTPLVRPLWYYIVSLHILLSFCFNSQRSGPYFVVFSSSFFSRFVTHGQLISSEMTRFDSWLLMRASTLLALTSWCAANRGTSQNTCALFSSNTGFGFSGEYQGGTEFTRPRSCRTAKKSIFIAALRRITYLFCARAVQPARTWATLSGPYYIACTSPHPSYPCAFSGRHAAS